MEVKSLSKRLDALSAQHGGKIPFGSMKGHVENNKTKKRAENKSKKRKRKSLTRQRRKSKGRTASRKKGDPPMSPRHLGNNVIQRGRDGRLYKVNEGKWVKVDFKK